MSRARTIDVVRARLICCGSVRSPISSCAAAARGRPVYSEIPSMRRSSSSLNEVFSKRTDVVDQLLWTGRSDQHRSHHAVVQQPSQRHFGERLSTLGGQIVQVANLLKPFRRQRALLQESSVMCDSAVRRNAVQIPVGQQSLGEREKVMSPLPRRCAVSLSPLRSTVRSKML